MKKPQNSGFSLLEILVTLAILGILVAITVPAYSNYMTRARIAQGFEFADASRIPVELMLMTGTNQNLDLLQLNNRQIDMVSSVEWVQGGRDQTITGHMLVGMNLPGIGQRQAFAFELVNTGNWQCVPASNYVPDNESVDSALLPGICDGNTAMASTSSSTSLPAVALNCPAGTDQIQTQNTGQNVSICLQQCPAGQTRNQNNPFQCDAPVTVVTQVQQPPAPLCGRGQDCSHQDNACPAGQEFITSATVNTKVSHDPFSSAQYSTSSKTFASQCVAKCQAGFVFDPNNPTQCTIAPSPGVHTCRGPKFICERSHVSTGAQCTPDAPFAANHIENLKDGSRYVTRSCISLSAAFAAQQANQNNDQCKNYNVVVLQDAHFTCTFPCYGPECNLESVPDVGLSWSNPIIDPVTGQSRAKIATDLPDVFD